MADEDHDYGDMGEDDFGNAEENIDIDEGYDVDQMDVSICSILLMKKWCNIYKILYILYYI